MMFKEAERRKEARVEKNSKRSHLESEVEGEVEKPVVLGRCVVVRVEIQLRKQSFYLLQFDIDWSKSIILMSV